MAESADQKPPIMHVLFEHASGYALFRVKEFEELGLLQPEVEASVLDLSRFNSIVKLVSFSPFKDSENSLENINAISEGIMHENLRTFLEANLPKASKKSKSLLGIGDSKLAASIGEVFGESVSCIHKEVVPEIMRGIRLHATKLIKNLVDAKAQLSMGLTYSRAKVKFNVNKVDNMVIQSSSLADQMEKDVNTNSMRLGEWYSYHFPELKQIIKDNYMFARVVEVIGDKKTLQNEDMTSDEDKMAKLEEIVMDSAKVKAIFDAASRSMGTDMEDIDLMNLDRFAKMVISLTEYRKELQEYLKEKMFVIAPNMSALIGEQVGARLISQAGSLTNLAKYPASTVQILGAEKALFRALKTKGNTPKYGLIFHSTFIGRAGAKNKGRISRYLANKTSIAARIDCFSEHPTQIYGEHLKQQVEDRLKFYDSGEAPSKNVDVMQLAITAANIEQARMIKDEKKSKKERRSTVGEVNMETDAVEGNGANGGEKKKKKKRKSEVEEPAPVVVDEETNGKKKKRKRKSEGDAVEVEEVEEVEVVSSEPAKKKKKKSKNADKTM